MYYYVLVSFFNLTVTVFFLSNFILTSNWKLIVPLAVVTCLFSATFFTKKDITFAVNIWVFPGNFIILLNQYFSNEAYIRIFKKKHYVITSCTILMNS